MTRLPLALACIWMAAMAAVANAQNYSGYAPGSMGGPNPHGTPPGIFPGAAQYHAAVPAPPKPKLPKGVRDEGGLLYYNGKPYQEPGMMMPMHGQHPGYVQQASYMQSPNGMPGSVMSPAQAYPMSQQQQAGQPYGGYPDDASVYGDIGYGECNGCDDPYCNSCRPGLLHGLFGWLGGNGRGLPGKMGSVWSAGGELVYYTREHAPDKTLVEDTFTGDPVITAQELGFDYEPGFRAWISYMDPSGIAAQFVYLQVNNLESSITARGNNDLQIPFPLGAVGPDWFGSSRMTVEYETNFQSFEANIIYPWSSFQLLAGYRYVQVLDRASIVSSAFDDNTTSAYRIPDCDNRLNGAQIGILGQYELFGLVNFDFAAKWGIYGNAMRQRQTMTDIGGSVFIRNASGTETDVAYVSELGARAVFPLGPTFSIQAGYDVLFINRLALGTEQFDFDVDADAGEFVSGGRNLIIHGISGGLTAKW